VACTAADVDGVDLGGGESPETTELTIWEFSGYRARVAIRDGKWKAVRCDVM